MSLGRSETPTSRGSNTCILASGHLNLGDETSLGRETAGHERDADEEKRATTKAVDDEPGNERGNKEPCEQKTGNERRALVVESGRGEQCPGVVDLG